MWILRWSKNLESNLQSHERGWGRCENKPMVSTGLVCVRRLCQFPLSFAVKIGEIDTSESQMKCDASSIINTGSSVKNCSRRRRKGFWEWAVRVFEGQFWLCTPVLVFGQLAMRRNTHRVRLKCWFVIALWSIFLAYLLVLEVLFIRNTLKFY